MSTHFALINPPSDVTAALVVLQHACAGWAPTAVADTAQTPPTPIGPPPTTEAQVCHYLADPGRGQFKAFEFGATLVLIPVVFVWLVRPHPHLARAFRGVAWLLARARKAVAEAKL